jgi:hypothetical protein
MVSQRATTITATAVFKAKKKKKNCPFPPPH